MATGPGIEIDILAKRFPGHPVALFEALRLSIAPGAIVALVGASGVGKSTLLRMIGGLDGDFSGSILVDGVPAAAAAPPGFVFQDARLLPWLTAAGNIEAVQAGTAAGVAVAELRRVGLASHANDYPHQLSGGMQRRVALARALSVNARLLLLDEPWASLDRMLAAELQDMILDLVRQSGATTIFVTHAPEDAAWLADRAIVLGGRPAGVVADLRFDGPPQERMPADLAQLTERLMSAARMGTA